jgi:hypothetical protein
MVGAGLRRFAARDDEGIMRTVIIIAAASLALAGCSSMSMDAFKPKPKLVSVHVDSTPPGADVVTSVGPGCRTPCSVSVPDTAENFDVSFTLAGYQPLSVPVHVTHHQGDYFTSSASTTIDPNPVVGELQPAVPPKKQRRKVRRKRAAARPAAAPAAPASQPAAPAPETAPPAR